MVEWRILMIAEKKQKGQMEEVEGVEEVEVAVVVERGSQTLAFYPWLETVAGYQTIRVWH